MKIILFSGPYGNLTSLYTGILAAHPQVVGLNHGRWEVPEDCSFFLHREAIDIERSLQQFIKNVLLKKEEWTNHALENGNLESMSHVSHYQTENPLAVFWKESGFLTTHLRFQGNAELILSNNENVHLFRPVRNPIDCIITNTENYHYKLYDDPARGGFIKDRWESFLPESSQFIDASIFETGFSNFLAQWWVEDFMWHVKLKRKFPKQVIIHTAGGEFTDVLNQVGIEYTEEWGSAANKCAGDVLEKTVHPDVAADLKKHLRILLAMQLFPEARSITEEFLR